ncbi:olfactomedin-4-like [Salarias fasciatus]|uniref:olfactomedin-4-like n=1 Tax=Salarias fasciatus TaxID=181472 RepID=UPI0011765666|nr:olfactomedin-4-like [Salarias fasciatus]
MVEQKAVEISHSLDLEMGKMENYQVKVTEYAEKIAELTATIESLEKSRGDHNEAELEEVKVEIKLVEALINELLLSMKSSTAVFDSLHQQTTVAVETLDRLEETYDKNRVLAARRDYIEVALQLAECEDRYQEIFHPDIGSCEHGGIIKVSKPIVSQLNAQLSSSYIYGGWGKDSKPLAGRESMYWFAGSSSTSVSGIKLYSDYKNLILRKYFLDQWLNYYASGNNYVVRDNTMYYETSSFFGVVKLNFTSMIYETKVIPGAGPISYSLYPNQYFDFAADESGLWLIYATEESKGMLFVAKINEESFEVEEQIQTSVYKPSASNAFVVCGVLYVVRTVDITTEEIFYTFDLKTKQESYISIPFERFLDKYSSLDYNPTDQKLYMYSEGYYVNYQVWFGNNTAEATV